ncbi:hypothetical protein GCM10023160_18640 [Brachybacterium paraconglomeratum]|uniref:hypothetical protein n=1 Tax=Brachybacterium paraconglomeratum TaxID=173362 RepID=UPI0031F079DE
MLNPHASHFYREPAWPTETTFCSDKALDRHRDGRLLEADVTRALTFFAGSFGDALASALLVLGKVNIRPTEVEVWVGHEWLRASGNRRKGDYRSPDIIIAERGNIQRVLLIIEVKGHAWVNGARGYCHLHSPVLGYSNQIICYSADCWTTADLEGVPRLIIGPDAHRDVLGGWGRKGLVPRIVQRYGLDTAFAEQQRVAPMWRFAGLRQLADAIEALEASPAKRDATAVLTGWLDRIGL